MILLPIAALLAAPAAYEDALKNALTDACAPFAAGKPEAPIRDAMSKAGWKAVPNDNDLWFEDSDAAMQLSLTTFTVQDGNRPQRTCTVSFRTKTESAWATLTMATDAQQWVEASYPGAESNGSDDIRMNDSPVHRAFWKAAAVNIVLGTFNLHPDKGPDMFVSVLADAP